MCMAGGVSGRPAAPGLPVDAQGAAAGDAGSNGHPLFRDFIGVNGHFAFRPALYRPVARLVRNYHNLNWDVDRPGDTITLPVCVNRVDWKQDVYGPWREGGFETDICVQFSGFEAPRADTASVWTGQEAWLYEYGRRLARYFGPSGNERLCTSVEIGNEPGNRFDPTVYRSVFTGMARGIRAGDPAMTILTPTVHARPADAYSQSLDSFYGDADVLPLYDVINVHTYAVLPTPGEHPSPWNRTFPEDTASVYLKVVDEVIAWRDRHAPDKRVWVTEFGYDAATPGAMERREGWARQLDWQGVTDLQQAQYLVRSLLVLAGRDVERAYIYYFDDNDEAGIHAASGLTRHFRPKPAYWAVRQAAALLGDYRMERVVTCRDEGTGRPMYVYEFVHGDRPAERAWVVWSPTGAPTHRKEGYCPVVFTAELGELPGRLARVEAMAADSLSPPVPQWTRAGRRAIRLEVTESPVYLFFR